MEVEKIEAGTAAEAAEAEDKEEEDEKEDAEAEKSEEELHPDPWDSMPSGSRLGIMGIDQAPGHSAKCWVCNDKALPKDLTKVRKGETRFWYRLKEGQAERSMHTKCVLEKTWLRSSARITPQHIDHSNAFLTRYQAAFSDELKEPMLQALDVVRTLVGLDVDGLRTAGAGVSSSSAV